MNLSIHSMSRPNSRMASSVTVMCSRSFSYLTRRASSALISERPRYHRKVDIGNLLELLARKQVHQALRLGLEHIFDAPSRQVVALSPRDVVRNARHVNQAHSESSELTTA